MKKSHNIPLSFEPRGALGGTIHGRLISLSRFVYSEIVINIGKFKSIIYEVRHANTWHILYKIHVFSVFNKKQPMNQSLTLNIWFDYILRSFVFVFVCRVHLFIFRLKKPRISLSLLERNNFAFISCKTFKSLLFATINLC